MIRLSKSTLTREDKEAVAAVLENEFLGMGPEASRFEQHLATFFSRPAVVVSNGTAALQLALQACGIGRGDEVLVPSLTYVASFQAVSATGAIPVACDVDGSLHLDPADAEKRITSKTKAIMPVHYGGSMGCLNDIYELANIRKLRVVEDAAHAFGSMYGEARVGSFGDISCFSFDGIKNITSGEGGCIVTSDIRLLEKVRDLRLLAVQNDSEKRYKQKRSWEFDVVEQGWRFHMSDIMAALGISQLNRIEEISIKRKKLAVRYDELFHQTGNIEVVMQDRERVVPHIYPVLLPKGTAREALRSALEADGIQTGIHYYPNHLLTYYRSMNAQSLETTESVYPRLLSIPLHLDLEPAQQVFVIESLIKYL